jgi:hypothetical protein
VVAQLPLIMMEIETSVMTEIHPTNSKIIWQTNTYH